MAPIPVYSSSPINAAKPSGVTPKTAESGVVGGGGQQPETSEAGKAAQAYPAAQPGATPSLPKQTAVPQANNAFPTPTRTSSILSGDPPPPQPGAVPIAPGHVEPNKLPPPPKAGESLNSLQAAPVITTMPPQMGYQPPQAPLPIQGRSSTATHTTATAVGPTPTNIQGQYPQAGYSPPAGGYQQDVNAAGYNQYQRSAAAYEDQGEASVWDTAKKWAASAGESLAAAEGEVWKRINKE